MDNLTPKQVLDELGLGQMRDQLANELFPGTSTLHTRSKYLLLTPWTLREVIDQNKFKNPQEFEGRLHRAEAEVV